MRFLAILTAAALIIPAFFAFAGENPGMKAVKPLPKEVSGWRWDGREASYDPESLYTYINGAAELYRAYNVKRVLLRRFENPPKPAIVAEIYQMASSDDAYGVFSFERQDPEAGIGQESEFGGGLLRFWKGSYFVNVSGEGEGGDVEEATLAIGRAIAEAIGETGRPPEILGYLPTVEEVAGKARVFFIRSHVLLNQRFFVSYKNILHMGVDVEGVLAVHPSGGEKLHLLLVRYPGEKAARDAYASFVASYMPDAGKDGLVRTEDGRWTRAVLTGRCVVAVFGAPDAEDARRRVGVVLQRLQGGRDVKG